MFCSQCGASHPGDARFCASCGSSLAAPTSTSDRLVVGVAGGPTVPPKAMSPVGAPPVPLATKMHASVPRAAVTPGEWVIFAAAVVLLVDSFLPWYSVDFGFGSYSTNGWGEPDQLMSILAILIGVAMAVGALVTLLLRLGDRAQLQDRGARVGIGVAQLAAGCMAAALVLLKWLGNTGWTSIGLYIGLLCTIALAVGGFLKMMERPAVGASPATRGTRPMTMEQPMVMAPGPGLGYVATPVSTNGFAVAALVFGILGGTALSIVFGFVAKSQIKRSGGLQGGNGMATAGIVLGFVWLGLWVAFYALLFGLAASVESTGVVLGAW